MIVVKEDLKVEHYKNFQVNKSREVGAKRWYLVRKKVRLKKLQRKQIDLF